MAYDPERKKPWRTWYSCGSEEGCCEDESGFDTAQEAVNFLAEWCYPHSSWGGRITGPNGEEIEAYSDDEKTALVALVVKEPTHG